MKIQNARFIGSLILSIVSFAGAPNAYAYTSSKDAHKACDPKGVQYDSTNKQFCCGTKGGCPGALTKPVRKDVVVRDKASATDATTSGPVKVEKPGAQGSAK